MAAPTSEPTRQEGLFDGPTSEPGISGPEDQRLDDELENEPEPAPEPDPESQRLARENAELQAKLQSERERLDRFLQSPAQPAAPAAPAAAAPMPDPAVEPEAFQRWLSEDQQRRETAMRSEMSRSRVEMSEQQRGAQLKQDFVSEYPHLRDVLEYADVEFMRLCPDGVIPQDTTALKRAIAQALEEKTGRRPNTPPTRTSGVSAGSEPKPKPRKSKEDVKEGEGSLVDCIRDIQSKSGLYG